MKPFDMNKPTRCSEYTLQLFGRLLLAGLFLTGPLVRASTPPNPAVELQFLEGTNGVGGDLITSTNTGTLAGLATFVQPVDPIYETNLAPVFTTNVPAGTYVPAGNNYSVDMGEVIGNSGGGSHGRAIDVGTAPGIDSFPQLTISGWLNTRALPATKARIAYALETPNGYGFELVQSGGGALSLSINQGEQALAVSSFTIPFDAAVGSNNWVYFAVTYDPTLGAGQVKYYFGRANKLAALDVAINYSPTNGFPSRPPELSFLGSITLGNFSTVDGFRDSLLGGNSHIFRGLIDEIKIYTNALTLDEVQQAQLNSAITPVAASILTQPINLTSTAGQNATFTVDATGSGLVTYQWKTNGVNVTGATNSSFTLNAVLLTANGKTVQVGVSNVVNGVLSVTVTNTVLPADPLVVWHSFSEGSGTTSTNLGSLAGFGKFKVSTNFPALIATNVPSGPFSPHAVYNPKSLHAGITGSSRAVDRTTNLISSLGTLGSMNKLTICGWINSGNHTFRTTNNGRGTAVVNASKGDSLGGFVLTYRNNSLGTGPYGENGRLALSVNEWVNNDPLANQLSSANTIPLDTNLPVANWIFFAVTYDGTLTTTNLNYYFGTATNAATADPISPQTYNKGVIAATGPLCIGNNNSSDGGTTTMPGAPTGRGVGGNNGTAFRGLMDEVKIFTKVLTLAEIQAQQNAPALPTLLVYSNTGPNLDLSWETPPAYPYQLQSRTNLGSGSWISVTNSESVSGNIHKVSVLPVKESDFFRINR